MMNQLENKKILVIGATGHVGSQVVINLAKRGLNVRAMVRSKGSEIYGIPNSIDYVIGDLSDPLSVRKALKGVAIVVNTANGIIPQKKGDSVSSVNKAGADILIRMCEEEGVERFIQSSVPVSRVDEKINENRGKRLIEERLRASPMQTFVVRNPAFMDVWLVMCGFQQAEEQSKHATTKRNYGFMKMWRNIVGDFALKRGWFIAPGGYLHGSPLVSTKDVAEMLTAGVMYEGEDNVLIESGGPEYLTWKEVSKIIATKIGRKKLRIIPMPAWFAKLARDLVKPFSPSASNVLSMVWFVASYQPKWDSAQIVKRYNLPKQLTLKEYLDKNVQI